MNCYFCVSLKIIMFKTVQVGTVQVGTNDIQKFEKLYTET